jgi:uncharacterized protein (DUF362 family)
MRELERREFLRKLVQAGFVVGMGGVPFFDATRAFAAPTPRPLAQVEGGDPALLVREALGKLGGMGAFVKKGDDVVVKPNIGWDRVPEEAANTNPEVVRELVRLALEAGAARVRVFDRTCNDMRRCYKRSGIADAVESLGDSRAEVPFVDDLRYEKVVIKGATAMPEWPLYRPALEADVLINAPVLKHHGLSGITVGMKNLMGVMGGNRGRIHKKLDESLVDLNMAVRSHLTVVDATRVLTANGPQGGGTSNVKVVNRLAASADVVAADAWAAKVFGKEPEDYGFLRIAQERGLGFSDLGKVEIL